MTLQIRDLDLFKDAADLGKVSRNRYSATTAAPNYVYHLFKDTYDEGYWDAATVERAYSICYGGMRNDRYVQFIPTQRPRTLALIAQFLGDYLPPCIKDTAIELRLSKLVTTGSIGFNTYKHMVELEYDYPTPEKDAPGYGRYKNRAWLTWFSWLRAGWEFLDVDDIQEDALGYLVSAANIKATHIGIHYSVYTGSGVDGEDVVMLLENLRDGYFKDGTALQDQAKTLLNKRRGVVEPESDNKYNDCDCEMCRRERGEL